MASWLSFQLPHIPRLLTSSLRTHSSSFLEPSSHHPSQHSDSACPMPILPPDVSCDAPPSWKPLMILSPHLDEESFMGAPIIIVPSLSLLPDPFTRITHTFVQFLPLPRSFPVKVGTVSAFLNENLNECICRTQHERAIYKAQHLM